MSLEQAIAEQTKATIELASAVRELVGKMGFAQGGYVAGQVSPAKFLIDGVEYDVEKVNALVRDALKNNTVAAAVKEEPKAKETKKSTAETASSESGATQDASEKTGNANEGSSTVSDKPITFDDVKDEFSALAAKNRDAAVAILAKAGVKKLGEASGNQEALKIVRDELDKVEA